MGGVSSVSGSTIDGRKCENGEKSGKLKKKIKREV